LKTALARLREELGALGIAALVLLAISTLFFFTTVKPLEDRLARLDRELQQATRRGVSGILKTAMPQSRPSQLAAFYRFFESDDGKGVWLAKLHGIAAASGIELRSGEYRLAESPGRIERLQIVVPVTGTYAQIWTFLEAALAEMPMLSLDQVALRRKGVGEPRAEADVSLTLHLLKR
jgi:hypothetical protein